ncbi:MAG: GGDEF domain-containing protein [Colwellia sp.]|nr:GGDEF domain-containing protein [Colwellia sp.]
MNFFCFPNILLRTVIVVFLINVSFYSSANPLVSAEETAQESNNASVATDSNDILNSKEPLPVNDRILSLLALVQEEPKNSSPKIEDLLLQLEEISATFNAAEHYLIFLIHGLIAHNSHQNEQAITWLKKTLDLLDKIPAKQLDLPEFSKANFIFAKSFAALGDFKKAFEYKKKYIQGGYRYFDETRIEKIEELNDIYETDHKIRQNELLENQNKIKRLKIIAAENKQFTQQRNIIILVITIIVFIILLSRQMKVRQKLKYLAKTDSLTHLYNRRTLFEKGAEAVELAKNEKQNLSVILLDVDFFKNINDNYGHDIGDEIIKIIAELGSETMRSRDLFARLGGEEFAGILPGVGCDEAKAIAERLREKVANKDLSEFNIKQKLTVSIGVACLDQVDTSFDDLLNAADIAMYFAKANGRNLVCQFNDQTKNNID